MQMHTNKLSWIDNMQGGGEGWSQHFQSPEISKRTGLPHLKRINMPLKEIERYMSLASAQNYETCYSVLYKHKLKIESQIDEMHATFGI
jgi:hypothetical protein